MEQNFLLGWDHLSACHYTDRNPDTAYRPGTAIYLQPYGWFLASYANALYHRCHECLYYFRFGIPSHALPIAGIGVHAPKPRVLPALRPQLHTGRDHNLHVGEAQAARRLLYCWQSNSIGILGTNVQRRLHR